MEAEGVCGEVALRGFVAAEETRRRRLSPAEGRPPWVAASSSSWSGRSSLTVTCGGLMARPPGRLGFGGGIGPAARLRVGPTGSEEGREPWGALRQA